LPVTYPFVKNEFPIEIEELSVSVHARFLYPYAPYAFAAIYTCPELSDAVLCIVDVPAFIEDIINAMIATTATIATIESI
jgi:hypothetical protein